MRMLVRQVMIFLAFPLWGVSQASYDVCVYGATSAGVIAAYSAKMLGKTVVLIDPGTHLGGLTSGGLGYTDIGNKYAIKGLALDFYRRIGKHYGKFEQWIFEPHVAENLLRDYLIKANITTWLNHHLLSTNKQEGRIKDIVVQSGNSPSSATKTINAKIFIDCSYEGDLMASAGVSYFLGREDNALYGETYNGVQLLDKHQFPNGVDPFKIPGDSTSGLLWGISPEQLDPAGTGDRKIQAYNFRVCLTNQPDNRIEITRPDDYDSSRYELLLRYLEKKKPVNLNDRVLKIDLMPNGKTDINNNGPFSTDMIGMNYDYPEASFARRKEIIKAHENYNKGLFYFIGHDQRVPGHLRQEMLQWGYPRDEYPNNNHWSPQLYVREARRMKGAYVMTQHNCEGREVVKDGIGMAAYTMDSHNCQRIVVNGMVKNEGDVQIGGFGPYPVSYRSIIPKKEECQNLLVPVCLSATHIAYGSIRMEPVFMALAQSAAIAASLAIDNSMAVQQVSASSIQRILAENPLLDNTPPDIVVDDTDSTMVIVEGSWTKESSSAFGPSRLTHRTTTTGTGYVQFKPVLTGASDYNIYVYYPKTADAAEETVVQVFTGKILIERKIVASDIAVRGQTSGEWVHIGRFFLDDPTQAYVRILNTSTGFGVISADAVLWQAVPSMTPPKAN